MAIMRFFWTCVRRQGGTIYWWDYYVSGLESMNKVLFRSFSKMFAALEWDES